MPSPFPGMDPWLEDPARWPGVHQALITYLRDEMQPRLRPRYAATIGERVYIAAHHRSIYPDVTMVQQPFKEAVAEYVAGGPPASGDEGDIAQPWIITLPSEEVRVPYIEIVHPESGEGVTVIELLSPINKTEGAGRDQYLEKQAEILRSQANLVEIDLLGAGLRTMPTPLDAAGKPPPHRYLIGVYRATDRERIEVYPVRLDQRLPRFRVPLRAPDPDIVVDLQAPFDRCYDNGVYADLVNYMHPAPVALSDEEQAWVQARLAARVASA
ncbi:MAG: hypothetical protein KatS3mg053_0335 [Candidatus Roseilinea sp.]|nr:MAG: hypothetical protein KatS3mg053_0335 [Candidatus Roseilinea sp.]